MLLLTYNNAAQLLAIEEPTPTEVGKALNTIHVREGFEVQLVAAEPLVMDPVAIDWGPDGKLWVVEMADYPLGADGKGKPGGRVRFLEDTDDDGQYDKSTLFAEGLSFPNGVLAWGRGILVTAAPQIVYLEDSTGNGKADVRNVLCSGFLEGNQQLRVNGLRWGLDNWVYCASGSHHAGYGKDSRITSHVTGQKHQIGSRDFRVRPHTGAIDPQSGPSQYGRSRDDWGHWFGVQNSHPLWHYVLADQNIRRNPHFAPPDPKHQVVTPTNPPVYPASKLQKRYHSFSQSGRFTSACSPMIYRDDFLFDRGSEQHAFTCEPFHNLVQHNLIAAAMSSLNSRNVSVVLRAAIQSADRDTDLHTLELIGQAVAMGEKGSLGDVIEMIYSPQKATPGETPSTRSLQTKFRSMARFLDGLQSRGLSVNTFSGTAEDHIAETIHQARSAAANHATAEDVRVASVPLLGRQETNREEDFQLMQQLLVPQSPVVLQRAVVAHLARLPDLLNVSVSSTATGPTFPRQQQLVQKKTVGSEGGQSWINRKKQQGHSRFPANTITIKANHSFFEKGIGDNAS